MKRKCSSGDTRNLDPYVIEGIKKYGREGWKFPIIKRATKSPYSKIVSITIIEKTI